MKILLIKPKWFVDGDAYKFKYLNRVPPLALGIIAALSNGHEVKILDEDIENIEYSSHWDLVGITTVTFTAKRVYKISKKFRKIGVKTVLGGPHPSILPEEGLKHADSVVIGEAEPVWHKVLNDLEKNDLKKIYNGNYLKNIDEVPVPRRDLFSKNYIHNAVQFTRGCPNNCFFCYLQSVPSKKYRKRSPQKIYEEIKQIKNKYLFMVDDNLFVDNDYVKKVMRIIAPLKKKWFIQAPTTVTDDEEMLDLITEAGCYAVSIGFQSVNQDTLKSANIYHNRVNRYKEIVKRLHQRDILVDGFFMFGFDRDNRETFKYTSQMIKEMDLDDAIMYILTPYPGTDLYKDLEKENRIINYDWSNYSWYNCNFKPRNMSAKEMDQGLREVYEDLNKHFRKTLPKRIWDFKKRYIKNPRLGTIIARNALNRVQVERLP